MKRTLPSNTFIALPSNAKAIKIDKRTGAVVVATGSVPNPRRATRKRKPVKRKAAKAKTKKKATARKRKR